MAVKAPVRRRLLVIGLLLAAFGSYLVMLPGAWTTLASAGRIHSVAEAPTAPVVIVFGAELAPGGTRPKLFLANRLDTTVELIRAGRATAVLASGDGHGATGDEIAVMTGYLVAAGVPARRIVGDPYGLDTYDTCRRAHDVYGVRRALLVSQSLHLPRAIALCRRLGIDAEGVEAGCRGCREVTVTLNRAREIPAGVKAAFDAVSHRAPAVSTPADPALTEALR
jgi:vancomycin permeability regulator SanA